MSTLLSAEPEANIVECSGSRTFRVQEQRDDHINELKLWQNETILDDSFSFQIRHFVSSVRRRDFSKCWPFRQKILDKCLSVGLKPFLPPFEPLLQGCDNGEGEYGLQQVSSSRENEGLCEESEGQDLSNSHKEGGALVSIEKLPTGKEERDNVPGTHFSEESNGDHSTGVDHAKSCADQSAQEMGITTSERSRDNDFEAHVGSGLCDVNRSDCGIGIGDNLKQSASLLTENKNLLAVKDADFHGSNDNELDSGSALDTGRGFIGIEGGSIRNVQQHYKCKFKSLSIESPVSEEQVGSPKSKSTKVGTVGQFETQLTSERLADLDHATASCTERNTLGLAPRLERSCKNGDDASFTGLNLDALVPQVCPVCLNFTSTSNTALNAHIDHCLESVLPGEKGESRVSKHKIKPRKMRSMVDICATAPTRTLEDLERSSKLWALHDESPKEESSCSPSWTGGLIRRQPRTSLHRGLAWKARSSLETDDTPQVSAAEMQPQLEKSQGEGFIAKQHKMNGRIQETAVPQEQSFEGQQLIPEVPSKALHMASPVKHLEKITVAKKKKKRGSTNAILSKEVVMSEECSMSNKEDEDQSWSVSLNLLGFTVIDTSAEEERRLLQKEKCLNGEKTEAGEVPQEAAVEDIGSKSGKFLKHQFSKGPAFSDLTSKKLDHKSSNEVSKKRLRTSIESERILSNEETSGEDDEVFQPLSERPIKSKKAAPKIKSLLTVVANSCKEKEKDAIEGLGCQKTNELQERLSIYGINTAPSGGSSGCQETRSKRRSLTSVQEDAREGGCELIKRARFCPEQPSSSEDLHLCSLSERGKSSKQGSVSSGRVQVEEEMLYTDCAQQDIHQCSLMELDGNLREERLGSLTSLLSMHHVEGKNSSQASERRSNVITVANTKDILVKAPLCSTEISDLSEIGVLLCRSGYDSLRKASANAPSSEVCMDNREEVSKTASTGAEQTSKIQLPISECLTAGNSSGNGSPFATFTNFNSVETDPRRGFQMLPAMQKSFFPEHATDCRPINNLRTKQPLYDSLAASNIPMSTAKDNESSCGKFTPQWYENSQSHISGIKVVKDNGQPQVVSESFENSGQCKSKCSVQHSARQAFRAGDFYERSGLNRNDMPPNRENVRILDNGNRFVMNKMDHMQDHHNLTETLQRVRNGTVSSKVPHHRQMQLGSRFLSSDLSPVILSSASESLQENGHVRNCDSNGHDYTPISAISTERMSLPSSLLADLAMDLADSRKAQETLQRSNGFSSEQQRALQASYDCTSKSLSKCREYSNLLPLQGAGKSCVPSASNGTVQPHVLHTAVQALKANTSIISPECVSGLGGRVTVSQVHNTLPSGSSFRADSSSSCMNGTRESFLGTEVASNLSNYGTVEYPVDQGVVHIFGNPVIKLMGQNVIVTSNSIKALGSCDQNGVQHFHPSSSVRHLGFLPETQNPYAHNLNPEVYTSTRLEAWHGDACMSRSHSFMMDNLEIQSQPLQSLAPTKSVHLKMPAHKDPVIFKPQMPMCVLDEGSRSSRSTRELVMKKLTVVNPGSKMPAEVFIDTMPGASSSLPAGLSRVSGIVAQQRGRQFTSNNGNNGSLPQNDQQNLAFPVQSTSAMYLEDIQKLDGNGCSTRYRSGTLADIVQSSERNNS